MPLWCRMRRGRRQGASGVPAATCLVVALLAAQGPLGRVHHIHHHGDDQLVEGRVAALTRLDEPLDPLLVLLDPRLGSVGFDVVETGVEGLVRVRVRARVRHRGPAEGGGSRRMKKGRTLAARLERWWWWWWWRRRWWW